MDYNQESVFNMALEYLKDISRSLKMCKIYSARENIDEWLKWLRSLYRELSVKLSSNEEKDILGDSNKIRELKKLTDNVIEKDEANFANIYYLVNNPELKITHKRTILFLLDALEVKIRKKLQEKGMLLPSKDDPRKAITRR